MFSRRNALNDEVTLVARCAALLHDIGHGPFSHVIEPILGFHHEDWSVRIISSPDTTLNQVLTERDPGLPGRISAVIKHDYAPRFVTQLLSSQLDVDRFDYLLRDSLMTGAKYGAFDLEWVLHALEFDPARDLIFVAPKGLYAVEEYLQARYYMFRQVYFHRLLRTATVLLKTVFRRAFELNRAGLLGFNLPESSMGRLLRGEPLTPAEYLQLDDHDFVFFIKRWTGEPDPILSDLASRFLHRRILKSIDLNISGAPRRELIEEARRIVRRAGYDPDYYLSEDRASDTPYLGPYSPDEASPESRIYIALDGGRLQEITLVSSVVAGMRRFHLDRLCFPEELYDSIAALVQGATETEVEPR